MVFDYPGSSQYLVYLPIAPKKNCWVDTAHGHDGKIVKSLMGGREEGDGDIKRAARALEQSCTSDRTQDGRTGALARSLWRAFCWRADKALKMGGRRWYARNMARVRYFRASMSL